METWLTYSPQDFLLFSERVYWRLFELHNADLWPAQIPAVLAGLAIPLLLLRARPWSGLAVAAILALAWAVAGLTFLPRYAAVNWLAGDLIPVFLAQTLLLASFGVAMRGLEGRPGRARRWLGVALSVYGLAAAPVAALAAGRGMAGLEVFALTPDATAIVTLGALVAVERGRTAPVLALIPTLWCLASWATLATLGAGQAWIFAPVPLVLAVAVAVHVRVNVHLNVIQR